MPKTQRKKLCDEVT